MNKSKIYWTKKYFEYLKNPFSCLLFKLGLKNNCSVKTKRFNNFELNLSNNKHVLDILIGTLDNNFNKSKVELFKNTLIQLTENKEIINFDGLNILNNESSSKYIKKGKAYEIDTISMKDLIEDWNIKPDILKIDCEGCEYEIIPNTDLSIFNNIILEHHTKITGMHYNILVDSLKDQGFQIEFLPVFNIPFEEIGIIHAYK